MKMIYILFLYASKRVMVTLTQFITFTYNIFSQIIRIVYHGINIFS